MKKTGQSVMVFLATLGLATTVSAQGTQVGRLMREKLQHAQKILEAVVTSNWASLETQSRELEALTNDPRWAVLKFPEYSRYSKAFVTAVQALHKAAVERDAEKTPEAYTTVVMKCVECHRYLARARIAR